MHGSRSDKDTDPRGQDHDGGLGIEGSLNVSYGRDKPLTGF